MRLGIMQPYLFPYLGYFQLINAVDAFVIYDDVNFIKRGWINRNYIAGHNAKQLITLPLRGASQNKLINEIEIGDHHKLIKTLMQNYTKAPHFSEVFPIIEDIFLQQKKNLSEFLDYQLRRVCEYLGLSPQWYVSSNLQKDISLRGQDKILAICGELGATQYINSSSGKGLYDRESFESHDIKLSFVQPRAVSYRQLGKEFIPNLSIIDVMMFNSCEDCVNMLDAYDLV